MQDPKDLEDLTGKTVTVSFHQGTGFARLTGKVTDGKGRVITIDLPGGKTKRLDRYWICEDDKLHPEEERARQYKERYSSRSSHSSAQSSQKEKDLEDLTGKTVDFILFSAGCSRYRGKVIDGKGILLKIELPGRIVSVNRYWLCEKGKIHPEAMLYGGSPTPSPVSVVQHPSGGVVTAPFYGGAAVGTAPIPSFHGIEICGFKIGVGSFPDDATPCTWIGESAFFLG